MAKKKNSEMKGKGTKTGKNKITTTNKIISLNVGKKGVREDQMLREQHQSREKGA